MKRTAFFLLFGAVLTWTACGGKSNSAPNVSGIKDRLFVSNPIQSLVQIVDGAKQEISATHAVSSDSSPTFMVSSPDGKMTLIYSSSSNTLTPIDNATETIPKAVTGTIGLGLATESVVLAQDNKTGYAAVRNFFNSATDPLGLVIAFDYTTGTVTKTIKVPLVRWLALNHSGKTLLAFSDTTPNSVFIVDLTPDTPTVARVDLAGFDHPVAGFFSTDDTKAYILNCGPECGGTAASVAEFTLASSTITRSVPVSAARIGMVQGTTLYVAGSPAGTGGTAQAVDTSNMTAGAAVTIGGGTKGVMRFASNKVWIGATNCSGGCLSLWDPSTTTATVDNPAAGATAKGDVTGMAFDTKSNIMYVAEGGELREYNTSLGEVATTIDIVGQAYDVIYVPQ